MSELILLTICNVGKLWRDNKWGSRVPNFPSLYVHIKLISHIKVWGDTAHWALSTICAREDTLQETDSPPGVRPDVLLHSPPAHLHTQTCNIVHLLSSKLYKEGRDFGLIWSNCIELYVRINNYFHLLLVNNFLVEKRRRKESRQGIHLYKNHYLKRELYYCSYCSLEAFCEAHPGPTGRTTDVIKYEFSEVS